MSLASLIGRLVQNFAVSDHEQDMIDLEVERYYGDKIARISRITDLSPSLIAGLLKQMPNDEAGFGGMVRYVQEKAAQLPDAEKELISNANASSTPYWQNAPTPSSP